MRILIWLLRGIVFVGLFGLAIKNSGPVELRLYFDTAWQAPLSLVVLCCFAAGALIGATAALATLVRQRREIGRLNEQARRTSPSAEPL
ncbi:MAG: LapA family protein [Sterolibacterium sp.]|jgi:uncharacterized integral membrane protein